MTDHLPVPEDARDGREHVVQHDPAVHPGERAFSPDAVTSGDDDTNATQSGVSRALDVPGEVDVDAVMQVIAIYVGKPLEPWLERAVRLVLARQERAS
jgi:hypothetical protein